MTLRDTARAGSMHSMSGTRSGVMVGALVGAVLGAGGMLLGLGAVNDGPAPDATRGALAEPRPAAAEAPTAASPAATAPASPMRDRTTADAPTAAEPRREAVDGPPFDDQLRTFLAAEIRRGWSGARAQPMPDALLASLTDVCTRQVGEMAREAGRAAATNENDQETMQQAFAKGDATALLRAAASHPASGLGFPARAEFATLFAAQRTGATVDGTLPPKAAPAAGDVIAFPDGVFGVGNLFAGREPFPSDVTIRGAGIDRTLLVISELRTRAAVERLTIADCTLFCSSGVTDMRQDPIVLRLLRVRIVGFDCGAGGSYALSAGAGMALLAQECRIEGGFGAHPTGYANLLRVSEPAMLRFERCVLDRVSLAEASSPDVVFANCTLTELLDPAPEGPRYEDCTTSQADPAQIGDVAYRRRDLGSLFPNWEARAR